MRSFALVFPIVPLYYSLNACVTWSAFPSTLLCVTSKETWAVKLQWCIMCFLVVRPLLLQMRHFSRSISILFPRSINSHYQRIKWYVCFINSRLNETKCDAVDLWLCEHMKTHTHTHAHAYTERAVFVKCSSVPWKLLQYHSSLTHLTAKDPKVASSLMLILPQQLFRSLPREVARKKKEGTKKKKKARLGEELINQKWLANTSETDLPTSFATKVKAAVCVPTTSSSHLPQVERCATDISTHSPPDTGSRVGEGEGRGEAVRAEGGTEEARERWLRVRGKGFFFSASLRYIQIDEGWVEGGGVGRRRRNSWVD